MPSLALPLAEINLIWYSLPLIVAISLVYSATRHEAMGPILSHAVRLGLMIAGFMAVIMGLLWLVSLQL
jgi:hypothetical protein